MRKTTVRRSTILLARVAVCALTACSSTGGGSGSGRGDGGADGPHPDAGAPTCDGLSSSTSCGICVNTQCCTEVTDCQNDADCLQVLGCIESCNGVQTCVNNCAEEYPAGVTDYDAFAKCKNGNCDSACGVVADAGTNDGGGVAACGFVPFSASCAACIQSSCCPETEICAEDAPCATLLQCEIGCGSEMSCISACENGAAGATLQEAHNTVNCWIADCPGCE
jgi:hypothetical protein